MNIYQTRGPRITCMLLFSVISIDSILLMVYFMLDQTFNIQLVIDLNHCMIVNWKGNIQDMCKKKYKMF